MEESLLCFTEMVPQGQDQAEPTGAISERPRSPSAPQMALVPLADHSDSTSKASCFSARSSDS